MSARQCGEGDGLAFAQIAVPTTDPFSDYAVDVYYVCREHLAPVLAAMVEDGDVVEVEVAR